MNPIVGRQVVRGRRPIWMICPWPAARRRQRAGDYMIWVTTAHPPAGKHGLAAWQQPPASGKRTRERSGWEPIQPGLIADIDQGHYFAAAAGH
jgi:hypothetical protein